MNFHDELNTRVEQINALMDEILLKNVGPQGYLMEAMRYSVLGGGKRLRPMLMSETGKLFSENADKSLK